MDKAQELALLIAEQLDINGLKLSDLTNKLVDKKMLNPKSWRSRMTCFGERMIYDWGHHGIDGLVGLITHSHRPDLRGHPVWLIKDGRRGNKLSLTAEIKLPGTTTIKTVELNKHHMKDILTELATHMETLGYVFVKMD